MSKRKRAADAILEATARIVTPEREDWVRAMAAEAAQISGDGPALRFALGCGLAVLTDRLDAATIGLAPRSLIALSAGSWAAAKFYVAVIVLGSAGGRPVDLTAVFLMEGVC